MCYDVRKYQLEDLSIVIVDDHEVVLEGIKSYMKKYHIEHVETFKTAESLLNRLAVKHFDIYIVDIELPDMEGAKLIDEIRHLHPHAKIIVNTIHEEMWVVRKMTEKQVNGVIYKSGQLEQLIEAIIKVTEGEQYFCSKFKKMNNRNKLQNEVLSKREIDVLQSIAQGYSTKEIARLLYISENTVETHRQNLFSKLKAHNMADLIVKAISSGYINPQEIK